MQEQKNIISHITRYMEFSPQSHMEPARRLGRTLAHFVQFADRSRSLTRAPVSPPTDRSARWTDGMATRRSVLGDAYVDAAGARTTPFDESFQTLITEGAWGSVWAGPGLTRRERSMITIALLAALGHDEEVAMHVRATRNTGASQQDVAEALLHVAIYAGVPAANQAFKIAKAVYGENPHAPPAEEAAQKGGRDD